MSFSLLTFSEKSHFFQQIERNHFYFFRQKKSHKSLFSATFFSNAHVVMKKWLFPKKSLFPRIFFEFSWFLQYFSLLLRSFQCLRLLLKLKVTDRSEKYYKNQENWKKILGKKWLFFKKVRSEKHMSVAEKSGWKKWLKKSVFSGNNLKHFFQREVKTRWFAPISACPYVSKWRKMAVTF